MTNHFKFNTFLFNKYLFCFQIKLSVKLKANKKLPPKDQVTSAVEGSYT